MKTRRVIKSTYHLKLNGKELSLLYHLLELVDYREKPEGAEFCLYFMHDQIADQAAWLEEDEVDYGDVFESEKPVVIRSENKRTNESSQT